METSEQLAGEGRDELDRKDMARLAGGQETAMNDLMERHAPRLFNFLLRSLGDQQDAADIAQEAFVRVYQSRKKFDSAQKFSTWLYAIASNLVRSVYRHRRRHPEVSLDAQSDSADLSVREHVPDQGQTPTEALLALEQGEAVRRAVGNLPEELRTPLILFEYEGLSHADVGAVLSCSAKAVENRIYRARKQLRKELQHLLQ